MTHNWGQTPSQRRLDRRLKRVERMLLRFGYPMPPEVRLELDHLRAIESETDVRKWLREAYYAIVWLVWVQTKRAAVGLAVLFAIIFGVNWWWDRSRSTAQHEWVDITEQLRSQGDLPPSSTAVFELQIKKPISRDVFALKADAPTIFLLRPCLFFVYNPGNTFIAAVTTSSAPDKSAFILPDFSVYNMMELDGPTISCLMAVQEDINFAAKIVRLIQRK